MTSAIVNTGQNALTLATCSGNMDLIRELLRYCTYKEFNNTTLMPALCVATMRQNWPLVKFYKELDPQNSDDIQTAHGKQCRMVESQVRTN